jgi:8-oxo-dGTP pyrophosphatase MutT (NUDIX family)
MSDHQPLTSEPGEITFAAGVIAKALTTNRILMVKRTDTGEWAFPGDRLEGDETAAQASYREFWEETQYRLGSVGMQLMQRRKDDGAGLVDFTTFLAPVESEFVPVLDDEHSSFAWVDCDETLAENRAGLPAVIADDADLEEPTIPPSLSEPMNEDPEDDLDDATLDAILAAVEVLEARLGRVEDWGLADSLSPHLAGDEEGLAYVSSNEPIQGGESHAELEAALAEEPLVENDRKAARQLGTRFRSA